MKYVWKTMTTAYWTQKKKDFFGYNKNFLITMHRNFYEEWNWKPDKHNVLNTYFWQFKVFFR